MPNTDPPVPLPARDFPLWQQLKKSFDDLDACMGRRPADTLSGATAYHTELAEALGRVGAALDAVGYRDAMDGWGSFQPGHGSYARNLLQLTRDPTPGVVARLLAQDARAPAFFDKMRRAVRQFGDRLLEETRPASGPADAARPTEDPFTLLDRAGREVFAGELADLNPRTPPIPLVVDARREDLRTKAERLAGAGADMLRDGGAELAEYEPRMGTFCRSVSVAMAYDGPMWWQLSPVGRGARLLSLRGQLEVMREASADLLRLARHYCPSVAVPRTVGSEPMPPTWEDLLRTVDEHLTALCPEGRPEPPAGFRGELLAPVRTAGELGEWINLQMFINERARWVSRAVPTGETGVLRNAYCLARSLRLTGLPAEPTGALNASEEEIQIRNLLMALDSLPPANEPGAPTPAVAASVSDSVDALFAADEAERTRKEAEARAKEEEARRRQQVVAENEGVRTLIHTAFRHALAFVVALPDSGRSDTERFDFYQRRATELGDRLPTDQTPATVAAAIVEAGRAADRGRGPARLDGLPAPGTPDNEHYRPLRFLVQLLRLGREGKQDIIARHLARLPESPALQRFLDWFGPVADALCGYRPIGDGLAMPQELPLPPGRCHPEGHREVSCALGLRVSPIGVAEPSSPASPKAESPAAPDQSTSENPRPRAGASVADAGEGTAAPEGVPLPPELRVMIEEVRRAAKELQGVVHGWTVWVFTAGARIEAAPPYPDGFHIPQVAIDGITQTLLLKKRAELALGTLYGHRCAPPSLCGRSLGEALALFPVCPPGPIDSERDKQFVASAQEALPALNDLGAELAKLLEQLDFAPLSVVKANAAARGSGDEFEPPRPSVAADEPATPSAGSVDEGDRWVSVRAAAQIAGCNSGVISRAADEGLLKSNGITGRARRIDAIDLTRWIRDRANKPESGESAAAIQKKLDKYRRD